MNAATLENMRRLVEHSRERQDRLNELIAETVRTGKPVFVGVWGPTGQEIYILAEARSTTV